MMSQHNAPSFLPIDLGMTRAFILQGPRPILIDTGNAGDDEKILDAMHRLGFHPTDLAFILISHGHHDHFGGAAAIQRAAGVTLAAGLHDAPLIQMTQQPHYHPTGFLGRLFQRIPILRQQKNLTPAQPGWLINGELDLSPYGISGRILPTPGHTAGSLSVILDNGEAFIGDMLMSFLRKGRPGFPIYLEDEAAWRESLSRVMAFEPRVLWVSHGGPYSANVVLERFPWSRPEPA